MKILGLRDLPKLHLWEAAHILDHPILLLESMEEKELLVFTEAASFFPLFYHWATSSPQISLGHYISCEMKREFKPPTFLSFKPDVPHTDRMDSLWNILWLPQLPTHLFYSVSTCITPGWLLASCSMPQGDSSIVCSFQWWHGLLIVQWAGLWQRNFYLGWLTPTLPFIPVSVSYFLLLW